jgi:hypothetical protein
MWTDASCAGPSGGGFNLGNPNVGKMNAEAASRDRGRTDPLQHSDAARW